MKMCRFLWSSTPVPAYENRAQNVVSVGYQILKALWFVLYINSHHWNESQEWKYFLLQFYGDCAAPCVLKKKNQFLFISFIFVNDKNPGLHLYLCCELWAWSECSIDMNTSVCLHVGVSVTPYTAALLCTGKVVSLWSSVTHMAADRDKTRACKQSRGNKTWRQ